MSTPIPREKRAPVSHLREADRKLQQAMETFYIAVADTQDQGVTLVEMATHLGHSKSAWGRWAAKGREARARGLPPRD